MNKDMFTKENFAALRDRLNKNSEAQSDKNRQNDDKKWSPTILGEQPKGKPNYYEVFILPLVSDSLEYPWVLRKAHFLKTTEGKTLYEPCPKMNGDACPICEDVNKLYATKNKLDESVAYKRYAKSRYFTCVKVITDPRADGINEGKVFIWEFGVQLQKILQESIDEGAFFFNPFSGNIFRIKIDEQGGFSNYLRSHVSDAVSKLADTDEEIEEILNQRHDLEKEYLSPNNYKDYVTLKNVYDSKVRGIQATENKVDDVVESDEKEPDEVIDSSVMDDVSADEVGDFIDKNMGGTDQDLGEAMEATATIGSEDNDDVVDVEFDDEEFDKALEEFDI